MTSTESNHRHWPSVAAWLQNRPSGTFTTVQLGEACGISREQAHRSLRAAVARCDPMLPGRLDQLDVGKRPRVQTWVLNRDLAPCPAVTKPEPAREPALAAARPVLTAVPDQPGQPVQSTPVTPTPVEPRRVDCRHPQFPWLVLVLVCLLEACVVAAVVRWGF